MFINKITSQIENIIYELITEKNINAFVSYQQTQNKNLRAFPVYTFSSALIQTFINRKENFLHICKYKKLSFDITTSENRKNNIYQKELSLNDMLTASKLNDILKKEIDYCIENNFYILISISIDDGNDIKKEITKLFNSINNYNKTIKFINFINYPYSFIANRDYAMEQIPFENICILKEPMHTINFEYNDSYAKFLQFHIINVDSFIKMVSDLSDKLSFNKREPEYNFIIFHWADLSNEYYEFFNYDNNLVDKFLSSFYNFRRGT